MACTLILQNTLWGEGSFFMGFGDTYMLISTFCNFPMYIQTKENCV